eukprot:NODE_8785_length_343_cov_120.758503_g7026_i0.p2 GENE.NODE_8785_length_343_cov_120.758503_g7026_i0~~NODE_8785_length_343_cov_120.758503_g7026_i0.p2  ORF type:complete len:88 (-),score=28.06 NODE_8785_length_343_cov_120.758503_g7026_i0:78-317(-)
MGDKRLPIPISILGAALFIVGLRSRKTGGREQRFRAGSYMNIGLGCCFGATIVPIIPPLLAQYNKERKARIAELYKRDH